MFHHRNKANLSGMIGHHLTEVGALTIVQLLNKIQFL